MIDRMPDDADILLKRICAISDVLEGKRIALLSDDPVWTFAFAEAGRLKDELENCVRTGREFASRWRAANEHITALEEQIKENERHWTKMETTARLNASHRELQAKTRLEAAEERISKLEADLSVANARVKFLWTEVDGRENK